MRKGFVLLLLIIGFPLHSQGATRSCVQEADEHGPFSIFQAQRLCAGTMTVVPALCGKLAARYLTTEQAVSLCTFATSTAPVQCASAGQNLPLLPNQLFYLCNQAQNTGPASCAAMAYELRIFTGDQIALLCFGSVDATPAACASGTYLRTRSVTSAFANCQAVQPSNLPGIGGGIPGFPPFNPGPLPPLGPGLPPIAPGPLPSAQPSPIPGGGGTGMFVTCRLQTALGNYQGIGFTQGQATAAARDQCLQVESVLACDAGHTACP